MKRRGSLREVRADNDYTVNAILTGALTEARNQASVAAIDDASVVEAVEYICRSTTLAGVRLLLACLVAKVHKPEIDPRKPYTKIGTADSFSGRVYDESYIGPFAEANRLPVNVTTAFLTPVLRNRNAPLSGEQRLVGTPPALYDKTVWLLDAVGDGKLDARVLLVEILRQLLIIRDEHDAQLTSHLTAQRHRATELGLSSDEVLTVVGQHLASPHAARLPVLVIAAAYEAASSKLGERIRPLHGHNAADQQTGALGDVEVCLASDDNVVTAYEMKDRRVTQYDVEMVMRKIIKASPRPDNYLIITTEEIEPRVAEFARTCYERTSGTEVAILDCLGFIKHFLHLFHRIRTDFLDAYQRLVLAEPDSSLRHELKISFLALRHAAETAPRAGESDPAADAETE